MTLRSLGQQAPTVEQDEVVLRKYLEQINKLNFINGNEVSAVIPAGQQAAIVPHALGRGYKGGVCTGVSFVVPAICQTPQAAVDAGIDITKDVLLYITAVAGSDVTVTFWVY